MLQIDLSNLAENMAFKVGTPEHEIQFFDKKLTFAGWFIKTDDV